MWVQISTTLKVSPAARSKLKRTFGGKTEQWWFAKAYEGEGSLKVGHSIGLRPIGKAGRHEILMRWFITNEDPPQDSIAVETFIGGMQSIFGEREVDVVADFTFDKSRTSSVFKPFDMGKHSQILDEIVGFTGIKKDPEGKTLYKLEIGVTEKTIEHKLSFRQTVSLSEDMSIPVVETASKISALAMKAKEA
jgi:hypothetical protein